jgi:rRNA maturation RNase YbeY
MKIDIVGPPRRRGVPTPDRRLLRARARRLLRAVDQASAELSITFLEDRPMADLNARWRGRPDPTDVLAFSLCEGEHVRFRGTLLGDVVIGVDAAARQARRARRTLDDEVARLLIHGVLHLMGFDHEHEEDARVMRAEERRLWRHLRS